ncbi:hypothetical protein [Terricaulis silvestris]|uniref:Secreted protein n=1 Tax=Terricaulis silvestris TaxID=2686094 RepID=A0A6I6MKF6_9CAUL|nr:hypothetical protein [Terricaulis silvestris]QGZ95159.1 hypothetical protein DSM104635_02003 [Terricaulis silvestris]
MRVIVAAFLALTVLALPAQAQEAAVFRCEEDGVAFYYRVGPNEFRHWQDGGAPRWLPNNCDAYAECSWTAGVFTLYTEMLNLLQEFDTNVGIYRWGVRGEEPTVQHCTRSSDPPPT